MYHSFLLLVSSIAAVLAGDCVSYSTTFGPGTVSAGSSWIADSPKESYKTSSDIGLELYLDKPMGRITTHDGVNNKIAEGATVNSTFFLQYGKVSFDVDAPSIAGVVTAAILIADPIRDEIDIELVGSDPHHWQTNIFAPTPADKEPLYGVFGGIHPIPSGSTISSRHTYKIDWTSESIQWSVDGHVVRTLHKADTVKNGVTHFPSHSARIQLGIWDASAPKDTSEWAHGPIRWKSVSNRITAIVRSVQVECH